ncbi:hypothetical protein Ddye_001439 [Dipteronia dyeriana]|uniref:Uncharacterized protein n=1 Tax=Dipteronia dyeriana TaxID=168575 RepID=A0AAD9XNW6_9ROSI|nr:hypothetical protein Ddye_001439 [Dipteronia dyeriana]
MDEMSMIIGHVGVVEDISMVINDVGAVENTSINLVRFVNGLHVLQIIIGFVRPLPVPFPGHLHGYSLLSGGSSSNYRSWSGCLESGLRRGNLLGCTTGYATIGVFTWLVVLTADLDSFAIFVSFSL